MTRQHQLTLLRAYLKAFEGWSPKECPSGFEGNPGTDRQIKHCMWKAQKMIGLLETEKEEPGEAARCIGFIQSVLWSNWLCSLEEINAHNRGEKPFRSNDSASSSK